MAKIIPIKDLKNTAQISELCHVAEEPVYVTKNGYGDMVIMSMDLYENMLYQQELLYEIGISEGQIREGKIKDAITALEELKKKRKRQASESIQCVFNAAKDDLQNAD